MRRGLSSMERAMQGRDPRMQTTTADIGQTELPSSVPRLTLLFANQRIVEDEFVLSPGDWAIGRGASFQSGILTPADDRSVSRQHASVQVTASADGSAPLVELSDRGSSVGTFVNGRRVSHYRLEDNDVIRLGHVLLHLRFVPTDLVDADVPGLLGQSPQMAAVRWQVAAAAQSLAPVLLEGELGTGKEVTARALHRLWLAQGRQDRFVAGNCATMSRELAASTLFGHTRGAFTGAHDNRPGLFRSAEGGTLFLDEIGELPMDVQPMLLRVLEERRVTPVGREDQGIDCDVRIITATNRALPAAVLAGAFRPDLHSRLDALHILLPPLCSRREEILPLLRHLWGGPVPRISWDVAEALLLDPWTYNIRGLRNIVDHIKTRIRLRGDDAVTQKQLENRIFPIAVSAKRGAVEPMAPMPTGTRPERVPAGVDAPRAASTSQSAAPQTKQLDPAKTSRPTRSAKPARADLESLLIQNDYNLAAVGRVLGRSRRQVRRWMDEEGLGRPGAADDVADDTANGTADNAG